jgi:hypothetical protein
MGIGMALLEHTTYDPQNGAPINSNLADYVVAVNADAPHWNSSERLPCQPELLHHSDQYHQLCQNGHGYKSWKYRIEHYRNNRQRQFHNSQPYVWNDPSRGSELYRKGCIPSHRHRKHHRHFKCERQWRRKSTDGKSLRHRDRGLAFAGKPEFHGNGGHYERTKKCDSYESRRYLAGHNQHRDQ